MLQVIKHKLQHLYQINHNDDSSALVLSKKYLLKKKIVFAFSHFNNFFLLTVTYQLYLFLDQILSEL